MFLIYLFIIQKGEALDVVQFGKSDKKKPDINKLNKPLIGQYGNGLKS